MSATKSDVYFTWFGVKLFGFLILSIYWALFRVGPDALQGEVYRILYIHVPSAVCAFLSAFVLFGASLLSLSLSQSTTLTFWGKASAEVGFLFTFLTLATGSIWGKPTWGTWWTWDARLTTTFVLLLLYAGYLLLWGSLEAGAQRQKFCAVLGVLIFVDVPIIYKSVNWWRTLHQPQSLLRDGGSTLSPEIMTQLILNIVLVSLIGLWFIFKRVKVLALQEEVEKLSLEDL